MKLREKRSDLRKPKAVEVVGSELSQELSLNQQIRLSKPEENFIRRGAESPIVWGLDAYNLQLETIIHLVTLFPLEANEFIQQIPVDEVIQLCNENIEQRGDPTSGYYKVINAAYLMSCLTDKPIPSLPPDALKAIYYSLNSGNSRPEFALDLAVQGIRLFPAEAQKIRDAAVKYIPDTFEVSEDGLKLMRSVLYFDPSLHNKLHAFALSHKAELEKFFQEPKSLTVKTRAEKLGGLFATYKLILADEIELSPGGILLAVEKPAISSRKTLPERSLAT